jgi:hypothetical protein
MRRWCINPHEKFEVSPHAGRFQNTLLANFVETSGQEREGWSKVAKRTARKTTVEARSTNMSMKPQGLKPIPEETAQMAKRCSPKGTLAMQGLRCVRTNLE